MTVTRAQFVTEARTWIGTPYRHLGRSRGVAVDCAGVLIGTARALALSTFDTRGYSATPHADTLRRLCDDHMARIPFGDAQPGDVLLLAWDLEPQHLAIVGDYPGGGRSLIHAWAAMGRCAEHRMDSVWVRRVVQAYAVPGVE